MKERIDCTCVNADDANCERCRARWTWSDGTAMSWWSWQDSQPGRASAYGGLGASGWVVIHEEDSYSFICERG